MIDKRPKTPREVAAFSLFSMAEEGAWSDGALHHYLSRAGLDGRDAALAARLTYGTVQNELLLDWYLRRFSSLRLKKIAPRVLACLRMGLYQLILMDKIPAHAAVAETVALVKHYCHANDRTVSFANAVMRKAAEAVDKNALPRLDCPDKESYYALRYSHPEWLVRLLSEQFGQKLTERICQADNADTPVSVRVNRMKTAPDEAKAELERAGMTVTPHRAFADILLCTGGDAAATEAFRAGRITVQDAASALAAFVADPKPDTAVLDCCAAPGGKSFAMAEKMQGKGSLTSCDIYEHKLKRIQEGAARLGLPNIRTELQDASRSGRRARIPCCATCRARASASSAKSRKRATRTRTRSQSCLPCSSPFWKTAHGTLNRAARSFIRPAPSCGAKTRTLCAPFLRRIRSSRPRRGRIRSAAGERTAW